MHHRNSLFSSVMKGEKYATGRFVNCQRVAEVTEGAPRLAFGNVGVGGGTRIGTAKLLDLDPRAFWPAEYPSFHPMSYEILIDYPQPIANNS